MVQLSDQVVLQVLSLSEPCLHKVFSGSLQDLLKHGPHVLLILRHLLHGKDLRAPGEHGNGHIVLQTELLCHLFKVFHIFGGQCAVIF